MREANGCIGATEHFDDARAFWLCFKVFGAFGVVFEVFGALWLVYLVRYGWYLGGLDEGASQIAPKSRGRARSMLHCPCFSKRLNAHRAS